MPDKSLDRVRVGAQRFRDWAVASPEEPRSAEWESEYPEWGDIYDPFTNYIAKMPPESLDQAEIEVLLYLIARDNELEYLSDELVEVPEWLIFLAKASLSAGEKDAKWQLACRLGDLDDYRARVEPLLLQFAQDEAEYVRRQALMALGRLRSPLVEQLVEDAWETGDECQRMAVLSALRDLQSPRLDEYLARAESDGRPWLARYAARVRAGSDE